jgi:hypothetical protein
MRSSKQRQRQDVEFRRKGKYARVNPCYACGKSAGVNYFSHPLTDSVSPSGKGWHDTAICLCKRCADATQEMLEPDEFLKYAAQFGNSAEEALLQVVKQREGA